jgi:hypothetical protein
MSNPTCRKLHSVTEIATAVVAANRFMNFAGTHALPGDAVQGVSEGAAVVGGAVSVVTGYSALVLAAGAIAAGGSVGPSGDGTGRAVAGGPFVALGSAAAGEVFEMALGPAAQVALVAKSSVRPKKIRSLLGAVAIDLVTASGLPSGVSFSGAGSYASAGGLAVQSTGTVTHNPTGWFDGTACLDFVPNSDAAELRFYSATGWYISDDDGVAFDFELPEMDTSKVNFSILFDHSSDAVSLFPSNLKSIDVWRCDSTTATGKEKAGRKYIRQRFDYDATDANAGAFTGYAQGTTGTGADRTAMQKYIRLRVNKFSGKTVKFKAVRQGGRSTPCFVMGSDNGGPEDLALRAFGYMAAKGMPGYANQYLSWLGIASILDRYRRIYAAGFDVNANDTIDRPLGVDVTDEATMRAAVETTRDTLAAYGFARGSQVWIANNNSSSYLMIRELARAGFVANRNGADQQQRYVYPEGGVVDAFRLPSTTIDNLNFTAIQPMLDRAITLGATMWMYWHGVLSSARIDADRTANVTGTAGAPIARSATESLIAYRARAVGLGTAIGTASVVYFDARVASTALGIWWEELKQVIDYLSPKARDGSCVVAAPEEWCADVGLMQRI